MLVCPCLHVAQSTVVPKCSLMEPLLWLQTSLVKMLWSRVKGAIQINLAGLPCKWPTVSCFLKEHPLDHLLVVYLLFGGASCPHYNSHVPPPSGDNAVNTRPELQWARQRFSAVTYSVSIHSEEAVSLRNRQKNRRGSRTWLCFLQCNK